MKIFMITLLAVSALMMATSCASKTTIGTTHHHVTVGGDIH